MDTASPNDRVTLPLPPRFQLYMTALCADENPLLTNYPDLTAKPWWDSSEFDLAGDLEENAAEIIAEFKNAQKRFFDSASATRATTNDWKILMLFERGRKCEEECRLAPVTTRLLERHRTASSHSGVAYFSRLAPNTAIPPHRGPTNLRLRCHLALDIPEHCAISVNGIERTWTPGKCLVFDDSYEHEAWNRSQRDRAILIIDFWHPELTAQEIALLEGLHRYVDAAFEGFSKYWDAKHPPNEGSN